MTQNNTGFVDVQFEAILGNLRDLRGVAEKSGDRRKLYELRDLILCTKFFFKHLVIPAYGARYRRCGRDFLELVEEILGLPWGCVPDHSVDVRGYCREIRQMVERLEKTPD